jgi:hypothetical protein
MGSNVICIPPDTEAKPAGRYEKDKETFNAQRARMRHGNAIGGSMLNVVCFPAFTAT